jgi:catechol 1,2-dioxygenase
VSAILNQVFRHHAPYLENEVSIVDGVHDGEITYINGIVRDLVQKEPVDGALFDV